VVHVGAMILNCGTVALVAHDVHDVHDVLGVGVLRRLWFSLQRVWAFALIGAGVATLLSS
jgi:hypothetical protein